MKRRFLCIVLLLCFCFFFVSCSNERKLEEGEKEYQIYYLDKDETNISCETYITEEEDVLLLIDAFLEQLKAAPTDTQLRATIVDTMEFVDYQLAEGQVSVNFGNGYMQLNRSAEVLTRAAIVRTLCQIEGVECVSFTVSGEPLLNQSGVPVGIMNAEQFVENTGDEINTYEKVVLTLYYANKDGKKLKSIQRTEIYNSNIALEKLVVDKLIAGPAQEEEGVYATINPNTKALSVTAKDGVCYVNLSEEFQTQLFNVTAEVTVYSLVNSLIELSSINKVQLSVDGETKIIYKESIPLDKPLERNFDLVIQK